MSDKRPEAYQRFVDQFPEVAEAVETLGEKATAAGPLDAKTARLVKLALSIGMKSEGAVHAGVRKALKAGATPEELYHVAILAISSIGFPSANAAITWVRDIVEK